MALNAPRPPVGSPSNNGHPLVLGGLKQSTENVSNFRLGAAMCLHEAMSGGPSR